MSAPATHVLPKVLIAGVPVTEFDPPLIFFLLIMMVWLVDAATIFTPLATCLYVIGGASSILVFLVYLFAQPHVMQQVGDGLY